MQRATFFLTHGPTHTSYLVSFAERALPSKGVDIGFAAGVAYIRMRVRAPCM